MKIIIAGSRNITDYDIVKHAINVSNTSEKATEVVCGMARGPDLLGKKWADENDIDVKEFPADWDKYGKSAGYKRNSEMADYADALLAIYDGKSRGTQHMINLARKAGLKTYVFVPTIVVNIHNKLMPPYTVYIGRRCGQHIESIWHNPFKITDTCNREESVSEFKEDLLSNKELLTQISSLRGAILGCWCKPKACHGDVLADFCNKGFTI